MFHNLIGQFNTKLNGDASFKASVGWVDNFKGRHGIRELKIEGEKMSAAGVETVNAFKDKFQKMIDELCLTRDQVYNADETGLNYKALPNKTLAALSEKYAPGFKMQKQRITAMVCANASGNHRLPLLLIGTAKKPRCFKGMNMNALPVQYYAQKSAWMDQKIFTEWFKKVSVHIRLKRHLHFVNHFLNLCKKVFVPYVEQDLKSKNLPQKAILVLDNAPSHPEESLLRSDDENITCYFLPANTTSLIQPMDQSVIETFKRRYRKKFIQDLVMEEDLNLKEYWKAYNLKNVVDNASDAWAEVSNETLKRSWNKLWPELAGEIVSETVERDAVTSELLSESAAVFFRDDQQVKKISFGKVI